MNKTRSVKGTCLTPQPLKNSSLDETEAKTSEEREKTKKKAIDLPQNIYFFYLQTMQKCQIEKRTMEKKTASSKF